MALPAMTLPVIRKPASIVPPKKGKRGIFSLPNGDAQTSTEGEARAEDDTPLQDVLADALAPCLPAKPMTARTRARKHRRTQEQDLVEVRRAFRAKAPGEWDAELFCSYRKRFQEEGKWAALSGLISVAAQATEAALNAGAFRLKPQLAHVSFPTRTRPHWLAFESLDVEAPPIWATPPPAICTAVGPLEAIAFLQTVYPAHHIVSTFEATDFSADGGLHGIATAHDSAQQEVMIRTTLDQHCKQISVACRGGTTPKGHLTAATDPYIVAAPEVMLFRGRPEDGYPFLKEQILFTMLIIGRASNKPVMQAKGEHFSMEDDAIAHMSRLHLSARAALAVATQEPEENNANGSRAQSPVPARRPVLVIAAHDLTVAARQQPRLSIANALRNWRQLYGSMFEAVVIACGDVRTATIMDKTVNCDIYAQALAGTNVRAMLDWPWSESLLRMSVNNVLLKIGTRMRRRSSMLDENGRRKSSNTGLDGPRRPSMKEIQYNPLLEVQDSLFPQTAPSGHQVLGAGAAQHLGASAANHIGNSMTDGGAPGSPGSTLGGQAKSQTGATQKAVGTDSRSAYERALANRLGINDKHNLLNSKMEYQKPESEVEANAGTARVLAVSAFGDKKKKVEHENAAKHEEQKREQRAKIDKNAAMLDMPEDMKAQLGQTVIGHLDGSNEHQGQAPGHHCELLSEVQDIAGDLGARLEHRRLLIEAKKKANQVDRVVDGQIVDSASLRHNDASECIY